MVSYLTIKKIDEVVCLVSQVGKNQRKAMDGRQVEAFNPVILINEILIVEDRDTK